MVGIYFIFSNNYDRDKKFSQGLHKYLPFEVDIKEGIIKRDKIIGLDGKLIREEVPEFIARRERPLFIKESAFDILAEKFSDEGSRAVWKVYIAMLVKNEVVHGEKEMALFIEELRAGKHRF